ncbi:hypothetical protein T265_02275 [Opisthorchis viverrini]|uniref:Uncharacterized protein n=1 Tax=Opisthorchis viverrini TaxID=6198 RepID=A0A074ZWK0_OPIVI|nr:hypothetical protein T265_02275 [Opisthorchis viverrini]KER31506.1 hypothetical protein T265_02275 [Opisthorchis viverrini]
MKWPGSTHSVALKHHKRKIQLGSRLPSKWSTQILITLHDTVTIKRFGAMDELRHSTACSSGYCHILDNLKILTSLRHSRMVEILINTADADQRREQYTDAEYL